jgi:hypothetical protein
VFELSRYEVTGVQAVLGHQPGSFFEDDLDPGLEQRMVERGAIRKVAPLVAEPSVPRLDDPQPNLPPPAAESTTQAQQEG